MKNQFKRIGALALALVFALCLMLPAFADGEASGTITVNGATEGKTYLAYRIFDLVKTGDEDNAGYAYTISKNWENFFFDEKGNLTENGEKYLLTKTDENTASNVASQILTANNTTYYINIQENSKSSNIVSFAQAALEYAVGLNTSDATATGDANGTASFTTVPLGYYLVYPQGAANVIIDETDKTDGNAYGSICSLTTAEPNASVQVKAEYPTITKTVAEDDPAEDGVVGVGDTVGFVITGKVPDTTGYKTNDDGSSTYTYTITDIMSKGLSFNDSSLVVKVDDTEITKGADYTLDTTNANATFALTIDVQKLQEQVGKEILVTYSATVTSDAITVDSITNTAELKYSNDPSTEAKGEASTSVELHTINVDVYAYAKDDENNPISGAEFVLAKEVKDSDGNTSLQYYKYDATSKEVSWVSDVTDASKSTSQEASEDDTTIAGYGNLTFKGISDGEYTLIETTAPTGYNKALDTAVQLEVNEDGSINIKDGKGTLVSVATTTATDATTQTSYNVLYKINHKTGVELPSTGGMGTKLFYIIGAALVIGAGVVLVVRRRMGEDE
jgi:fimbrial isopeptide formation D2 family protein/LPXTG-motif cell wall-anchored protein